MGELPTGGAAFIAAGGCWGGGAYQGRGEASSGLWTFRRGRELCLAPKAGLWGSQPAFVTQSEAGGEPGGGRATHQLRQFTLLGTRTRTPFWLTAQKAH